MRKHTTKNLHPYPLIYTKQYCKTASTELQYGLF